MSEGGFTPEQRADLYWLFREFETNLDTVANDRCVSQEDHDGVADDQERAESIRSWLGVDTEPCPHLRYTTPSRRGLANCGDCGGGEVLATLVAACLAPGCLWVSAASPADRYPRYLDQRVAEHERLHPGHSVNVTVAWPDGATTGWGPR